MKITIHAAPNIPWQKRLAPIVQEGLHKHNIKANISNSPTRLANTDIAIILGPNFWKNIEMVNKPYIMMNRKFLGFGERDVHDNVAISWDGFNGRGKFCVDEIDPDRILRYVKEEDIHTPVMPAGEYYLLCEQADVGRCKRFSNLNQFYSFATKEIPPQQLKIRKKINPESMDMTTFRKAFLKRLENVKAALVLNSTVSVEITLAGIPVLSFDEGDPVYAISSRSINDIKTPYTRIFLNYLAHCQWHYSEIESGKFWDHIYPKRGPRLCEWKDETNNN